MTHLPSTYIFAGGGTGGHLAPAVAVAERITELDATARVLFLCTERAIDRRFLAPTSYGTVAQPIRPMPGKNLAAWPAFLLRWRRSLKMARRILRDVRPAAVLGLGGFAAGPMARVASGRVRTGLLNPDAIPGKANRYLAGRVDAIFTQFDISAERFGDSVGSKIRRVGCPVRRAMVGVDRAAAVKSLALDPNRRTLAVMGGSLGAESVNKAVPAAMDMLSARADRWQVLHITGPGKAAETEQVYRAAGVGCVVMDFCDEMGSVYAAADILIGRGGANTVAELTATGTPGVLMPYPWHADRHQAYNAAAMVDAGAAILIDDAVDPVVNAGRLTEALSGVLDDEAALGRMAAAAAAEGAGDAAEAVARWLMGDDV